MSNVVDLTSDTFADDIAVLCFKAGWCGPCKVLAPIYDDLSVQNEGIRFYRVSIEDSPELTQKYGIHSVPALVFIKKGEVVKNIVGLKSRKEIQGMIDTLRGD